MFKHHNYQMFCHKLNKYEYFYSLEVVSRYHKTQVQVDTNYSYLFNPLSPRDALKHHFTSLKTDLISLQLGVLERKFPLNWFTNT